MKTYAFYFIVASLVLATTTATHAQSTGESQGTLIRIETLQGNMVFRLYDETPIHRDNMIKLVEEGYFDGQLFHRIISDFMIQGGDPHSRGAKPGQRLGQGGPGYTLEAEFHDHLIHKKGVLAAARKGDSENPEKRSSGSQFYIVQGSVLTPQQLDIMARRGMGPFSEAAIEAYTTIGGSPHLDGGYTVFGEMVEGWEVLDRIAAVETNAYDRPVQDVIFTIKVVK